MVGPTYTTYTYTLNRAEMIKSQLVVSKSISGDGYTSVKPHYPLEGGGGGGGNMCYVLCIRHIYYNQEA